MRYYSVVTFKAKLAQILKEIFRGEEVIITDHNRPVAKVTSVRRFPALPHFDVKHVLNIPPILLKSEAESSVKLIRKLRDEG